MTGVPAAAVPATAPPAARAPFSGSYDPRDCWFLLKPLPGRFTPIDEKERLIQQGGRHYSEMISFEEAPSDRYLGLFRELTERYRRRLAREVLALAGEVVRRRPGPLTVVSLARAGTPVGALVHRALVRRFGADSLHCSISIVRDRGIDEEALRFVLRVLGRPAAGVVFLDAWTAKGVITRELKAAVAAWNAREPEALSDELWVVSDIGGSADVSATTDDYAIPSGVLNATVSGLVSRSVLDERIGPGDFHGCVLYDHLRPHDLSGWFLDQVTGVMEGEAPALLPDGARTGRQVLTAAWVSRWMEEHGIDDVNHVKPGVAEATRVMLRRVPDRVLLRDPASPDVAHLVVLAEEKRVPLRVVPEMPFQAAAFIRTLPRSSR